MSLFKPNEVVLPSRTPNKENIPIPIYKGNAPAEMLISVRGQKAIDTVGNIEPNKNIYFPSFGAFSMHDVMLAVALQATEAELFFCTWAISEEPVRGIMKYQENGIITSVKAILNYRAKQECPAAFQLFSRNYPYCFDKTHAKITLVKGKNFCASIFGSANLTVNPRNEFYCINTETDFYNYNYGWMNEIFKNNHELLN